MDVQRLEVHPLEYYKSLVADRLMKKDNIAGGFEKKIYNIIEEVLAKFLEETQEMGKKVGYKKINNDHVLQILKWQDKKWRSLCQQMGFKKNQGTAPFYGMFRQAWISDNPVFAKAWMPSPTDLKKK